MPQFNTSRRVAVPADVAFEVASDVSAYAEFLPLLESVVIRGPTTETDGVKKFSADLAVGYAKLNLRERFTSKVSCDQRHLTVTATSHDPPFKTMTTQWKITRHGETSDVAVMIDYSMRSMLLQFAMLGAMDMAVNKVMSAFELRAKYVLARRQSLKHANG
jgi:ribosome-associated toxin RatA of RatAB toxin-antitoxin module